MFIQVIRGQDALRPRMGEVEPAMKRHRPDVLGDAIAVDDLDLKDPWIV